MKCTSCKNGLANTNMNSYKADIIKRYAKTAKMRMLVILILLPFLTNFSFSQINLASPSNWLYPDGNAEATHSNPIKSNPQLIDSFSVKWFSNAIYGDVQPLVGNIINNDKLFPDFFYAPNEIAAVLGNQLVIIDATGKVFNQHGLNELKFIKGISCLIDTNQFSLVQNISNPVVMGLETIESVNDNGSGVDSLSTTYVMGFDNKLQNSKIVKRLVVDMRKLYSKNIFASIRPVFGKRNGSEVMYYAAMNITKPTANVGLVVPQFLRGFTQFDAYSNLPNYPSGDVSDDLSNRVHVGPEVSFAAPSLTNDDGTKLYVTLPSYPTPNLNSTVEGLNKFQTLSTHPYLFAYDINSSSISDPFDPDDFQNQSNGTRPQTRPYYVKLNNDGVEDVFILLAEEYKGIDGSVGKAGLHLYDKTGIRITFTDDLVNNPPFYGGTNHQWSIGYGNVDGNVDTNKAVFFPHNMGNEIVASQSSKDFAYPGSKLFVLKYNSNIIDKPSPPNTKLAPFDTICSARINGWVAAVNDIDGASDDKAEIILVDGSKLMILRMKDYNSVDFQFGRPFDTVYVKDFPTETITSVEVADLEGDNLNDIIVTTFTKTYILGTPLNNVLKVLSPRAYDKNEKCLGDTVNIVWRNYVQDRSPVNVLFQETKIGKTPLGADTTIWINKPFMIKSKVANPSDTSTFKYSADTLVKSKSGFFIVQSTNSTLTYDSTTIMTFQTLLPSKLSIYNTDLNDPATKAYRVGDTINVVGDISCSDSVTFQYSYDDSTWTSLHTYKINEGLPNGQINFIDTIPCLNIFGCSNSDKADFIYVRIMTQKSSFFQASKSDTIKVKPAIFPVYIDSLKAASPTKDIKWFTSKVSQYTCDTVSILYSIDNMKSYIYVTSVAAKEGGYLWSVPLNIPDSAYVRVCCENSCVRFDTLMTGLTVKLINAVAPNPYNPLNGPLQIIYKVLEKVDVNIKVMDQNNRIVAEPVKKITREPGFGYADFWDGVISNGDYPANGLYYISLELSNGVREVYPLFIIKDGK